jgi:DNA-directed RNA polymerase beta' subunit
MDIQRKICKVLEDCSTRYDMTVRDGTNRIIQFSYGEDDYDGTKTVMVDGIPQACDIYRLAERLNTEYERNC